MLGARNRHCFVSCLFPTPNCATERPCIPQVSQGRRQFSCSALPFLTSHLSIYSGHQPLMDTSPSRASLEFLQNKVGLGLPWWLSGKESACQCRRCRRCVFDPWVGKILWRRKWQPTPVFLPVQSHGQRSYSPQGYSPQGHKDLDTTE